MVTWTVDYPYTRKEQLTVILTKTFTPLNLIVHRINYLWYYKDEHLLISVLLYKYKSTLSKNKYFILDDTLICTVSSCINIFVKRSPVLKFHDYGPYLPTLSSSLYKGKGKTKYGPGRPLFRVHEEGNHDYPSSRVCSEPVTCSWEWVEVEGWCRPGFGHRDESSVKVCVSLDREETHLSEWDSLFGQIQENHAHSSLNCRLTLKPTL